jgi:hypothetical protein
LSPTPPSPPSVGSTGVDGSSLGLAGSEGVVSVGVVPVAGSDGWLEGRLL